MNVFGLIGYPLEQSFSKKYFTEKFNKEERKDCSFENFPIQSIDLLSEVLNNNPDLKGFAVTIPHKQSILSKLHSLENIPEELAACNCIKIKDGKLIGFNTDYLGFEKSFIPLLKPHHKKALVLGNGGSAAAVCFVLKNNGIQYKLVSRQLHDGSSLTYKDLNESILNEYSIIINTTPLGMYPKVDDCAPIPYSFITDQHYLYDLVYNPYKTMFLIKGEERGAMIKNGADMLVFQAEENWRIWNDATIG